MPAQTENRQVFADAFELSDDQMAAFDIYADLLSRWQAKINLVGPATLSDIWTRHFFDSAQLSTHLPEQARVLADIGSGAGFPGLVLAVLTAGGTAPRIHLIESDARKAAFLREASRETGAGAEVLNDRAENIENLEADVVTARACAPLTRLLPWTSGLLKESGTALFLKGGKARDELTEARKEWTMKAIEIPSQTNNSGVILKLENLSPIPRVTRNA